MKPALSLPANSAELLLADAPLDREQITAWMRAFQQHLCDDLERVDGQARFRSDRWDRLAGGGGDTRVIRDGDVLEKGGVAFSAVWGELSPAAANALQIPGARDFYATGVSVVLHPRSPWVPITHMNVRYFEADNGRIAWFGGGADLTPIYVDPKQAGAYHRFLQASCENARPGSYQRFKEWADEYFYLPFRQETRGIGGVFADRLGAYDDTPVAEWFPLIQAMAGSFCPAWAEIVNANRNRPYAERELEWQRLRRGRYAEFNLVMDRGTKFGLETGGRTESIMMSLPPLASWEYNHHPEPGTPEAQTLQWLRKGIDWVNQ